MEYSESIAISVVVPALNEEKILPACLKSLKQQELKQPFEIIVVDNGSEDKTTAVAKSLGVKTVSEPQRGLPLARQRGLELARGEIIAFIDADSTADKGWLAEIIRSFENKPKVIAVSGPVLYTTGRGIRGKIPHLFARCLLAIDRILRKVLRKPGALWGGNFALRKAVLLKAGGFDTKTVFYGEDVALSLRIGSFGRIDFNPRLLVTTSPRRFEALGFIRAIWLYVATYLSILILGKKIYKSLSPLTPRRPKRRTHLAFTLITSLIITLFTFFAFYPTAQLFGKVYPDISHPQEKIIALTFDDGPDEPYTSQVLAILKDSNVHTTFFLIGENAQKYPDTVHTIVANGNIIGNHSLTHSYQLPFKSKEQIATDILDTENIIFQITGNRTALFRPPHGLRTPFLLQTAKKLGYTVTTWNDMTNDYNERETAQEISKRIIKNAKSGGIIVLHDGKNLDHNANRENTVEALPIIIQNLKEQGYSFVTIPELLKISAYQEVDK